MRYNDNCEFYILVEKDLLKMALEGNNREQNCLIIRIRLLLYVLYPIPLKPSSFYFNRRDSGGFHSKNKIILKFSNRLSVLISGDETLNLMMADNSPTAHPEPIGNQHPTLQDHPIGKDECFVCHGFGHWARECTSLPATFLRENAPKCYNCYGIGHYARFCPNRSHPVSHSPLIFTE